MEPFFGAKTPDGRWSVRVAEAPEHGEGWYFASVTLDDANIVESLTTDDTNKLLSWVRRQMTEALRRTA